ncbi:MAG: recombination protein RecR [Deltaproteobacteria bacterium]|nr:recombination protein RecR [Deltaproteobacteria bacterium]
MDEKECDPLELLTRVFKRLPSIGPKSAQRLSLFILRAPDDYVRAFSQALERARTRTRLCSLCCDYTEEELCPICSDPRRNKKTVCVVEQPTDLRAIEKTNEYNGMYHVLHGALSPLNAVSPADLKIKELVDRVKKGGIEEIIIATNADTEGDVTASYLMEELKGLGLKITRIGTGMPAGGELEYTDPITLTRALSNRKVID